MVLKKSHTELRREWIGERTAEMLDEREATIRAQAAEIERLTNLLRRYRNSIEAFNGHGVTKAMIDEVNEAAEAVDAALEDTQ